MLKVQDCIEEKFALSDLELNLLEAAYEKLPNPDLHMTKYIAANCGLSETKVRVSSIY